MNDLHRAFVHSIGKSSCLPYRIKVLWILCSVINIYMENKSWS